MVGLYEISVWDINCCRGRSLCRPAREIAGIIVDQYIIIVITGTGGHGNPPLQKFNNYHPLLHIIPILYNTCAFLSGNELMWNCTK